MIVTMTSCAPVFAFRKPGTKPHAAPPMIPARSASGRWMKIGSPVMLKPTSTAVMPPMSSWPSPPMLNRPARNAIATDRPARMSGVAAVRVSEIALTEPTEPTSRARYAASASPRLAPVSMMMMTPITRAVSTASSGITRPVRQLTLVDSRWVNPRFWRSAASRVSRSGEAKALPCSSAVGGFSLMRPSLP